MREQVGRGAAAGRRILIVAGEASGDLHGAELARELFRRLPDCELLGVAGAEMRAAGVRPLYRVEDLTGLGLVELASTLGLTLRVFAALKRLLRESPPDLLVLIDFAEFNLALAGAARRAGVPVLYYILPQVWAWRRARVKKLLRRADKLALVFPFEAGIYAAAGARAQFVGHPLLDRVTAQEPAAVLSRHGFAPEARLLVLLPGSRPGEIRHLLKTLAEAARLLARRHGLVPVLVRAPTLTVKELERAAPGLLDGIRIVDHDAYSIIGASRLALCCSGTATLETALLGCPMVVVYKVSGLTYALARLLVRGVRFIAMPNILAGRKIVPELIQRELTVEKLVESAEPLLEESAQKQTRAALAALRAGLGTPGAAARVAEMALDMIR